MKALLSLLLALLISGCTTTLHLEDAAEIERRSIEEDALRDGIRADLLWLNDEGLLK